MKIFIFPGASSAFRSGSKYEAAYASVARALELLGHDATILSYPGQLGAYGKIDGELEFHTAHDHCLEKLQECKSGFGIISFCYGSIIAAALASRLRERIGRCLFWAPLPMWRLWQDCVLDLSRWSNSEQERGVRVTPKIVENMIPFEVSIQHLAPDRFRIAMGTLDELIPPATLEYYEKLSRLPSTLVPGVAHTPEGSQAGHGGFAQLLKEVFESAHNAP